ncbi:hypothetical protein GUITHDRAFT_140916 [Guillardia theta CCMP2712]|uniref:Uncharacterized protein n=1 Tax=Guillardia theta (strain CCMP2712) TaxID=905079 RepID=L1J2K4_GUITC|nr:hypothetical protein GUITHDRAFT_140916 [Guillardia theta CCMP2712]EKX42753.1 hypothetical protein GUITHDRAFT_140916 [Guillardia theta CCMP2712]|eukprot:XP_005829733.1 hypothetical protein GUITHDRAFT_140916 [Guillardia theta CCMP2712]
MILLVFIITSLLVLADDQQPAAFDFSFSSAFLHRLHPHAPQRFEAFQARRLRTLQQLCFLPAAIAVKTKGLHYSQEEVKIRKLSLADSPQEIKRELGEELFRGRGRPAWGRLANLAGARMIWRSCRDEQGVCLVLEDDAEFTEREGRVLSSWWSGSVRECHSGRDMCRNDSAVSGCLPWDLMLLGVSDVAGSSGLEDVRREVYGKEMKWIQRPAAFFLSGCVEAVKKSDWGSHAYLVTPHGATKLLQAPADLPTDVLIGRASEERALLAYVVRPSLVRQKLGCSSTEGTCK